MTRRNSVWWLIPALVLGVLSVAFSFAAYAKRIKADDVGPKVNGECVYPNSGARTLGVFAASFLLVEQIWISCIINCFCCCGRRLSSTCSAITSLIFFVLSWLAFVIAYTGLIYAAVLNSEHYLANSHYAKGEICKVGKENLFLGAAIWCILTIVLGLISYACWTCSAANNTNNNHGTSANYGQGIAMGQPHTQLSKEQY